MNPLDRLSRELLNLERHLAVAGLTLLEAQESTPPEDVKMVLDAFGYRYKPLREFLQDHGETARSMQKMHQA